MNELQALAADFGYAAGPGAQHLSADVESDAEVRAQTGIGLPHSRAGALTFAGEVAMTAAPDAEELAARMAQHAAREGAQIIERGQQ